LPAHVQLQLDIKERLPAAAISLTQLEQILMNLIKNSTESMHSSGRINIQLYANSHHEISTEQSPALTISIQDEGIGIAPEDIDKVSKPFWTSRSKEGGTGLGLAMVQRIVRNNGGDLDIQSTLGKGTQINITFPPMSDSEPRSNEKNEDSIQTSKRPNKMVPWHILLVDDSPTVLRIHQHLLEQMGHKVTTAEGAEAAFKIYQASLENSSETIDLLATDFRMGGMDGIELSQLIRQHDRQLPILIITAYGDAKKLQQGQGLQVSILGKPTSYKQLQSLIIKLQRG
ncbi:MAG: ATP-binding protein, partial [Mariprofundaceae bacterium]|nr:ATP-binding protein [Mariprofundaceae bacterium]